MPVTDSNTLISVPFLKKIVLFRVPVSRRLEIPVLEIFSLESNNLDLSRSFGLIIYQSKADHEYVILFSG